MNQGLVQAETRCLQTLWKSKGGGSWLGLAILPESLLAGGVPNLQLDRLPADIDHSGAKLHANGVVGVLFDCAGNGQKQEGTLMLSWSEVKCYNVSLRR